MRIQSIVAGGAAVLTVLALAACSPEDSANEPDETGTTGATEEAPTGALDGAAYDAVIAAGPIAEDGAIEASAWASAVRDAGVLRVGGTETSELFSLLDTSTGTVRGFDAGLSQLLSQYILGEVGTELTQVSVDTREELLVNGNVDTVFATYSITPERAERISFAGPYYTSQSGILVAADNTDITSVDDLAGKTVATQANSTGETVLEEFAPDATILPLPDHAQALEAVQNGNADAYVIDYTLLLNAVVANDDVKIVGEPFGPGDNYGIGVPLDSDGVDFINDFLDTVIADGTWAELWQVTIGDRTGVAEVPTPPTPGDTGLDG